MGSPSWKHTFHVLLHVVEHKLPHTPVTVQYHYCVLYKNRRDQEQIQRFGRQAFLQQSKYFLDAYLKAASTPYGYLLVDLNPHSCKLYSFGKRAHDLSFLNFALN
jgi:hypothetical protein